MAVTLTERAARHAARAYSREGEYTEDEALSRKGLEFAFPEANGACLRMTACHAHRDAG
mgnify:CR=1 FL=1